MLPELPEPPVKRAIAFVDGQNLFHAAREVFGYTYPNYDVQALARAVVERQGWTLLRTHFYTGVPAHRDNPHLAQFWEAKLAQMGRQNIRVFSRPVRYRPKAVTLSDGTVHSFTAGEEKGIDVRLAIDVIRLAIRQEYDVALILSQDQDLSEAAQEVRVIAREQKRWIKVASAYPHSARSRNQRGVNKTEWLPIDRTLYDACLDPRDYRPKDRLQIPLPLP